MKNVLGIIVLFNKDYILTNASEFLASSLKEISSRLIVVINGNMEKSSITRLQKYSSEIIVRENIGFDGGAYKDVFLNYLQPSDLLKFDELVLCNDTFWGPLYPFTHIFQKMRCEKCDFWGLSRHLGGTFLNSEQVHEHIQGYFIVCNKKMFLSEFFYEFWKNLKMPVSYTEAVLNFEIGFSLFFTNHGFLNKAYNEVCGWQTKRGYNNYFSFCGSLLKDYKFPILKKKSVVLQNFKQALIALNYIKLKSQVLYGIIKRELTKDFFIGQAFDPYEIEELVKSHKRIWIYGAGKIGNEIKAFFDYKHFHFEGFIVTKLETDRNYEVSTKEFNEIDFFETDGIILALGKVALNEVLKIKEVLDLKSQLLIPKYK